MVYATKKDLIDQIRTLSRGRLKGASPGLLEQFEEFLRRQDRAGLVRILYAEQRDGPRV